MTSAGGRGMRGGGRRQVGMLSLVSPERLVPPDHPIRRIKALADAELVRLSPVLDRMYGQRGRPSIPPEALLKAQLLIALYSVRSERQFCEQLRYNLLFRYFLDLGLDEGAVRRLELREEQGSLARRGRRGAVLGGDCGAGAGGAAAVG